MIVTDPVSDMITRIRNATRSGLRYAIIPASALKFNLTKVLEAEGMICGFRLIKDKCGQGKIKIALKYTDDGVSVIRGIRRVSKPSCRVYKGNAELSKVREGLGFSVVSTSKGVMTNIAARKLKVGGEVMFQVW